MPRKTKEEKRIENETEAAFKKHGNGVQFDMMDLSKINDAGILAGKEGRNIEEAVKEEIQKFRKN